MRSSFLLKRYAVGNCDALVASDYFRMIRKEITLIRTELFKAQMFAEKLDCISLSAKVTAEGYGDNWHDLYALLDLFSTLGSPDLLSRSTKILTDRVQEIRTKYLRL